MTDFALLNRRLAYRGVFASAVALALAAAPAHALVIQPTFDASITGNGNAAQIESSINAAITAIDNLYGNAITVPVEFSYTPGAAGNLLSTSQYNNDIGYSTYVSALQADSTAHPGNTVLSTALANLSKGNDANGAKDLAISTALYALLTGGAAPTVASGFAPLININSNQTFGFSQPVSGVFDLTGGLEHELNEVLGAGGAGSTLNNVPGCVGSPGGFFCNKVGPLDLYRYSSANTPVYSATSASNPNSYFSVNGGTTNIAYFNQNLNGDMADFAGNVADGATNQCGTLGGGGVGGQLIQNAFNCTGPDEAYTSSAPEFAMEESIGWDAASVPEPGTMVLFGTALYGLAKARRRRAAR